MAREIATWSKDPSTQVAAIIITETNRPVSWSYNGFPQAIRDDPERYENRDLKYKLILHAEINALSFAERSVAGCTLYTWPFAPCVRCAVQIVQRGIARVIAPETPEYQRERWAEDLALSEMLFKEAGIELVLIPWTEIEPSSQ